MADQDFEKNPWSAEFWNLTRQGMYIKKHGAEVAKTKAAQAGAKLGDLKPNRFLNPNSNFTVVVQRRNFTTSGGGGGADTGNDNALVAGLITKV